MGAEQKTHFQIDKSKCIKCGKCINTCSGMVIEFGADGYPQMKEFERFGWRGCWRCQHCLAVCPQGAISIFGKKPEDSLLSRFRRTGKICRHLTDSAVTGGLDVVKMFERVLKTEIKIRKGKIINAALRNSHEQEIHMNKKFT